MPDYSNSAMKKAIEEYCHNSRYREVLHLKFCEGYTYEEIGERVNFSPQHVKHICRSYKSDLMRRL